MCFVGLSGKCVSVPGNSRMEGKMVTRRVVLDRCPGISVQRDLSTTSVRSSEIWGPLKCSTSSITDFEIDAALSEIEREMAAIKRSHP
jgi:hypothetical protein